MCCRASRRPATSSADRCWPPQAFLKRRADMMTTNRSLKAAAALLVAICVGLPAVPAGAKPAAADLVAPIADYKIWISEEIEKLIAESQTFVDAVKAGQLDRAKALYAPARVHYERIEPIAELFSDLDKSIDVRADDFEKKEADPNFSGFHRLEYGLFAKNSTEGLAPVADKLMVDLKTLRERIKALTVPPEKVVGGAAVLIEEVAKTKISGEENRYSGADLWDFNANVEGAGKIHDLLRPLTAKENPKLVKRIDDNFAKVNVLLARYQAPGGGFVPYEKVSKRDRNAMRGPINALAEDLSKLRGVLGLQ
ncbi:MAG: iron uptake system protein EfeO [Rhizobiales bacterium]|nr:iron uptake system protein EfeO [Hyphomicrobiales bacterium]